MTGEKKSKSHKRNQRRKALIAAGRAALKKKGGRPNKGKGRTRGKVPAEVENMEFPGVIEAETSRNPMSGAVGRGKMYRHLKGMSMLPERGREFVHRHCNPCGEMVTFTENSKIPDGALPNSLVLELREAFIVRYPGATVAALPLDGSMWNLTMIHLPAFRTPAIFIAKTGNSELTDSDRELLVNSWNTSGNNPPRFPNWEVLATDDLWYTCVKWTALDNIDPPTDAGTTNIQQFRITADGITGYNNTPDLVNQGMCIGAQWSLNTSNITDEASMGVDGYTGNIHVRTTLVANEAGNVSIPAFMLPLPVDRTTLSVTASTNMSVVFEAVNSYPWDFPIVRNGTITLNGAVVFNIQASEDFIFNSFSVSRGDIMTWTVSRTAGGYGTGAWTVDVTDTTTSTSIYAVTAQTAIDIYVAMTITSSISLPIVTKFQLPPTDTQAIIQSTPKAVYFSMKEENGFYMVKRVFQPVFNVQEANQRKQIMMTDPQVNERQFSFAPLDVFDLNYGVGTVVMSSIPTSCAPAFKMIRDVEIVAGEGSAYTPLVKSNEDKIEAACEIVRCMAEHHPFMYPESYNVLGSLMGLISNVVGKVPILGNVVSAVGNIVKGLTGGETNGAPSGASQNRLTSTNIEELGNLAQMLMRQLNIGGGSKIGNY